MSQLIDLPRPAPLTSGATDGRLHPYVALVRRYGVLVALACVVGALLGVAVSQLATPIYSGRSTLYFSIDSGVSGSDLNQGASYAQSQMLSFAELAGSERVLQPVIDELDLGLSVAQLAGSVEATTPPGTVVLDIEASSPDPSTAASIANGVARSLAGAVRDLAPRDADGGATVEVRTVQSATAPTSPSSPNTRLNIVAGALVGLLASLLVIVAMRLLDTRVRDERAVLAAGAGPLLGRLTERRDAAPPFSIDPAGEAAEDYRRLAALIDATDLPRPTMGSSSARTIMLAAVADGRASRTAATATANLAVAAAEAGLHVAMAGDAAALSHTADARGSTVVGHELAAPGGIPSSAADGADLVLAAAPDGALSSRALVLGRAADAVVLLADERDAHIGELKASAEQLALAGVRVLGTVITATARHDDRAPATVRSRIGRVLPALEHHEA